MSNEKDLSLVLLFKEFSRAGVNPGVGNTDEAHRVKR